MTKIYLFYVGLMLKNDVTIMGLSIKHILKFNKKQVLHSFFGVKVGNIFVKNVMVQKDAKFGLLNYIWIKTDREILI